MGVAGPLADLVGQGADIVELVDHCQMGRSPGSVPVCVTACDDDLIRRALSAGVALLRLPRPAPSALVLCAAAGAAVVVPPGAAADAAMAGLPADRIVSDVLLLDVTAADLPVVATAVGVIAGARIVRTAEVGGARRVCDVLAAVLEAT